MQFTIFTTGYCKKKQKSVKVGRTYIDASTLSNNEYVGGLFKIPCASQYECTVSECPICQKFKQNSTSKNNLIIDR